MPNQPEPRARAQAGDLVSIKLGNGFMAGWECCEAPGFAPPAAGSRLAAPPLGCPSPTCARARSRALRAPRLHSESWAWDKCCSELLPQGI